MFLMSEEEPSDRIRGSSAVVAAVTTTSTTTSNGNGRRRPSPAAAISHKRPRLRAATSISSPLQHHYRYHHYLSPASCMAIRRTGRGGVPLAAIGGPMGITIVDLSSPQLRPWLTLDYGSFNNGGITTMAFQPCPSSQEQQYRGSSSTGLADEITYTIGSTNNNSNYHYSYHESSILLATARGSGILIWDCSGRVLSPLLGRLNASNDSFGSDNSIGIAPASNTTRNTRDDALARGGWEEIGMNKQEKQRQQDQTSSVIPSSTIATTSPTGDAPKLTTVRGDFNHAPTTTSASLVSNLISKGKNNIVSSIEWKGPSAPILLSTCGDYACVWDLRTSLFSGTGMSGGSGGARPNARYHHHATSSSTSSILVHCAYCRDESKHVFATLDSMGIVRVWDDRKADSPKHSFSACPGGGVGIASIPPPRGVVNDSGIGLRWLTWGMDDGGRNTMNDDLVVKVWSEFVSTENGNCEFRSTAPYHVTSQISMAGAVSARVHPSFAEGVLLFRENFPMKEQDVSGLATSPRFGTSPARGEVLGEGKNEGLDSAGTNIRTTTGGGLNMMTTSPEMSAMQMPPSPPTLVLEVSDKAGKDPTFVNAREGWEAELWRIDVGASPSPVAGDESVANERRVEKIVAFRGGGVEEDALSFAPGRGGDASDVIAVDLTLGAPADNNVDELSVCVLTKAGRLTVYCVVEDPLRSQEKATDTSIEVSDTESHILTKCTSSVIRKGTTDHGSEWWKNNEEQDLFGESDTARMRPSKHPVVDASKQIDVVSDNIAMASSTIADVGLNPSMEAVAGVLEVDTLDAVEDVRNLPIDPNMASRVPCPPLCGISFSGIGGVVMFHNGPVKRLWSYYQSNTLMSQANKSLNLKAGNNIILSAEGKKYDSSIQYPNTECHRTCGDDRQSDLPRTLLDLVDMNLRSQTLQWGDGDNIQSDDDVPGDDGSNSTSTGDRSSFEDGDLLTLESEESCNMPESEGSECSADNLFDEYFSSSRKSLVGTDQAAANEAFAGSLSPSVSITTKYRETILSDQTPQLANLLMLGDQWWLSNDFSIPDSTWRNDDENGMRVICSRYEFPRDSSDSKVVPSLSDRISAHSSALSTPLSKHGTMMGNLKKLFAHQLPTAMTPPDQRLMNKRQNNTQLGNPRVSPPMSLGVGGGSGSGGVYMLQNAQLSATASEQLAISHKLCLHNAGVCSKFGQKAKADTWTLLAQTIESIFTFEIDETDGWGSDAESLTAGIVEQILQYYEVQGDFQMLSTIVCVLSFGRDRRHLPVDSEERCRLLPGFDERRYDNYLHQYAALLYGWGFLNVRSEMSKRLTYATPGAGTETITWLKTGRSKLTPLPNAGEAIGVTFTPVCGMCMEPVSSNDNICRQCNAYPFQCSICCNSVCGVCTWCPLCGHGGHLDHITEWFQRQTVCPTGCGCVCMNSLAQKAKYRRHSNDIIFVCF